MMRAYRDLLSDRGVVNITAAQLFARLPLGMISLAILLHVEARADSYALAGAVVACVSVGQAVAMPMTARLAGHVGMVPVLVVSALLNSAGFLLLGLVDLSTPSLMLVGLLIGVSVPPLMPVVRALYPEMVSRDGVRALFALDATAQELIWVVGPVVATVVASAVSTALPLVLSAVITVVGTGWFLAGARRFSPQFVRSAGRFGAVLFNRALLLAMAATGTLIASFLALEVALVADFDGEGYMAGVAISVASLGSLIGGLTLGHRRLGLAGLVCALTTVMVGIGLYASTDVVGLQLAALFLSGLGFAPSISVLYLLVSREVDPHGATEAFGWLNSAGMVGGAAGTALGGVFTDWHGPAGAVAVSAGLTAVALISPLIARLGGPVRGLGDEPEPSSLVDGVPMLCPEN